MILPFTEDGTKDVLGYYFRAIYEDRSYDDSSPLFPSTFAAACNMDWHPHKTRHGDAFLRRLHQPNDRLLFNAQSVSCTLSLAFRVRPFGALSFMRHIVLFPLHIVDVGVNVRHNPAMPEWYNRHFSLFRWFLWRRFRYFRQLKLYPSDDNVLEANSSIVTLPLQGFSSFNRHLYKPTPRSYSDIDPDSLWQFVRAIYSSPADKFMILETALLHQVKQSGSGPASPFTRLVEEILLMKDRETQFMFLRVVWLEKLIAWKLRTFGRFVYLSGVALPMLMLFLIHLIIGILLTASNDSSAASSTMSNTASTLACLEAILASWTLLTKVRQSDQLHGFGLQSVREIGSFVAAVRTLRALYIIVISTLLLNTLIALLNLKVKSADKHVGPSSSP